MKQISIYRTEQTLKFNLEMVEAYVHAPLTELQSECTGFTPVYDEDYFCTNVQGYTIFKVRQSKRAKLDDDAVDREFQTRQRKVAKQGVPFDMDELYEGVVRDATRLSKITTKDYLTFYDHVNEQFLIDAPRNVSEDVMQLMHTIFEESCLFEVVMPEQALLQKLLTSYVVRPNVVPDPFVIGEDIIELGAVCLAGKKAKGSNISIKKEPTSSKEVIGHLADNKRVNKLTLNWDGVINFHVDNTLYINKISFEEGLDYEPDAETTPSFNFISEYTPILYELSKMMHVLYKEVAKTCI